MEKLHLFHVSKTYLQYFLLTIRCSKQIQIQVPTGISKKIRGNNQNRPSVGTSIMTRSSLMKKPYFKHFFDTTYTDILRIKKGLSKSLLVYSIITCLRTLPGRETSVPVHQC